MDTPTPTNGTPEPAGRPKGHTLDLSSGGPARPRRKGPPPLVTKTIDLSTKAVRPEAPAAPAAPPPPPAAQRPRAETKGGPKEERARNSGGTSLADLLDPDTLARLRGGR